MNYKNFALSICAPGHAKCERCDESVKPPYGAIPDLVADRYLVLCEECCDHFHNGDETINDSRKKLGLPEVPGGDMTVVEWAKMMPGLVLKPDLKLVPSEG